MGFCLTDFGTFWLLMEQAGYVRRGRREFAACDLNI